MDEGDNIHRFILALLVFFCTLQIFDYVCDFHAGQTPDTISQDLSEQEEKEKFSVCCTSFKTFVRTSTRLVPNFKTDITKRNTVTYIITAAPLYAQHAVRIALHHVFCVYRI